MPTTDGSPEASRVEMNELVLPSHANAMGTVFGGQIMAWIDICGALSAMRHSRLQCVTASMDALDFIKPIQVGDVVRLQASVNYVGRSSMEVGVRVDASKPTGSTRVHVASAYLTFVALDENHRPIPIRPLVLQTDNDRMRAEMAKERRVKRLELAHKRKALRQAPSQ